MKDTNILDGGHKQWSIYGVRSQQCNPSLCIWSGNSRWFPNCQDLPRNTIFHERSRCCKAGKLLWEVVVIRTLNPSSFGNHTTILEKLNNEDEDFENLALIAEYKQVFARTCFQWSLAPKGSNTVDRVVSLHRSRHLYVLRAVKANFRVILQCYMDG